MIPDHEFESDSVAEYEGENEDESSDSLPPEDLSERTAVITGDQVTLNKELERAKEQEACLIIIRGTPQGHRFFLTQPEMTLGRDPIADITISDPSISRKHATVTKKDHLVTLTDLGSVNGSFINDRKLVAGAPVELEKEDMVRIGNTILKYLPAGELEILFYGSLGSAAHTDALTKIYNKGYLDQALEAEFKRARALHQEFSVLFFDLDHFKNINDTYSHDAGDYVLREFANLVKTHFIRQKDVFARFGGEEFVVLLSSTDTQQAADIAERIRIAIENHTFVYGGKRLPVTSSMGVASMKNEHDTAQALLNSADKALYAAKNSGRNRVVVV